MLRSCSRSTARLVISVPASYRLSVQIQSGNRRNVSCWTSQTSPLTAARRSSLIRPPRYERLAKFHTSPPRRRPFFAGLLASILKASASLEVARTVTKIALTFLPIVAVRNFVARRYLKKIIKHHPELAYKRDKVERHLRKSIISYRFLIAVPIVLFGLTFLASLERTPLSGRWRVILLSPEEEESILKQLQGDGWYRAVLEVISQDGPPNIIPPTDWRYQVVESVLRRLEGTIPILAAEKSADLPWPDRDPDDIPFPPPAKYPLKPRPRAKEYLRWFCDTMCCEEEQSSAASTTSDTVDSPHLIPGPPYNLVLVDRPDCDNAFSFGFGPDGGGGIVVYSGFLDRIFGDGFASTIESPSPVPQVPAQSRSIASEFMGSLLAFSRPISSPVPQPQQPLTSVPREPTEEQLTQIAILLAHELSHLILSHHLESLSAGTVFLPGTVSIFSDLVRAVVFPITMIFGPFVNDAVANWGKIGAGEFVKLSEYCTSVAMEFEADTVSTRVLAHAGFDARATIKFWMHRRDSELSECSPSLEVERARYFVDKHTSASSGDDSYSDLATKLVRRIMSAAHPAHEARLLRLKSELHRWETERLKALKKKEKKAKKAKKEQKKLAQG